MNQSGATFSTQKRGERRSFYSLFGIDSVDGDEAPTARLRCGLGVSEACEAGGWCPKRWWWRA
ncbi:hypothetical protein V6Z11_A08G294900 [Gossypium hirsutum]